MTAMKIDRDEECGCCGLPRHAHWGGYQALAAGRCAGFQSNSVTKIRTAAPDMLAELRKAESFISGFEGDETQEGISDLLAGIRAAIAKAGGRS